MRIKKSQARFHKSTQNIRADKKTNYGTTRIGCRTITKGALNVFAFGTPLISMGYSFMVVLMYEIQCAVRGKIILPFTG